MSRNRHKSYLSSLLLLCPAFVFSRAALSCSRRGEITSQSLLPTVPGSMLKPTFSAAHCGSSACLPLSSWMTNRSKRGLNSSLINAGCPWLCVWRCASQCHVTAPAAPAPWTQHLKANPTELVSQKTTADYVWWGFGVVFWWGASPLYKPNALLRNLLLVGWAFTDTSRHWALCTADW